DCKGDRVCEGGACVETAQTSGSGAAGGSEAGAGGSGASTASSSSGATCQAPFDLDAPKVLSFGTNVTTLTEGQSVSFSTVVTDPQGIDNLIGGTLKDENGATYGSFATSGQEGAYALTLSWDAINQVEAIAFDYGGKATRTFAAEFFDVEGHSATS